MFLKKFKKAYYLIINFIFKNKNFFLLKQQKNFIEYRLDRNQAKILIQNYRNKYDFLNSSMNSEHQILFASLSINYKNKVNKILEIGTYDGSNAFLLSKLFPNAEITTIDLPDNDELFTNSYNRKNKFEYENFIYKRNQILSLSKNICFKKMNSLNLISEDNKFDLIWVDGAHGHPYVTVDIANAIRLSNNHESIILIDDIFIKPLKTQDIMYYSNSSISTLKAFEECKLIDFKLFLKRVQNKFNYFPDDQKFIAIVKKKR